MNHPIASHPSHPPPALSSQEQERVRDILSHRWSENTQKAYASMWRLWCSWCNQESMEPLLSEESALFRYVLHLEEEGKSYTTISNHLIAIRHGHKAKGQPLPNASDELRLFLEALRKKMRSRPKRKTPLTIERLQRALESMQLEGWERALLVWGFATGCRRGELVALRVEDIEVEEKGMRVHLRASKTNQAGKEEYISVPREWGLYPSMLDWCDAQKSQRSQGWLFPSINRPQQHLSCKTVARLVKRAAEAINLDPSMFSGHSLRAGVATSLDEAGADLRAIGAHLRQRDIYRTTTKYVRADDFRNNPMKRL